MAPAAAIGIARIASMGFEASHPLLLREEQALFLSTVSCLLLSFLHHTQMASGLLDGHRVEVDQRLNGNCNCRDMQGKILNAFLGLNCKSPKSRWSLSVVASLMRSPPIRIAWIASHASAVDYLRASPPASLWIRCVAVPPAHCDPRGNHRCQARWHPIATACRFTCITSAHLE
jgi:hypothetical protein